MRDARRQPDDCPKSPLTERIATIRPERLDELCTAHDRRRLLVPRAKSTSGRLARRGHPQRAQPAGVSDRRVHSLLTPPANRVGRVVMWQTDYPDECLSGVRVDAVQYRIHAVVINQQLGALITDMRHAAQQLADVWWRSCERELAYRAVRVELATVDWMIPPPASYP